MSIEVANDHEVVPFTHGDGDNAKGLEVALAELAKVEPGSAREMLYKLQAFGGSVGEPVACPLQHTYSGNVYARTICIPAGTFIVGKIHKHEHLNVLSQGIVRVYTEGGGIEELAGPLTMVSKPGTKRALLALTDLTWTTLHEVGAERDLDKIEAMVIAPTYEDYEQFLLEGEPAMKQIEVTP